MAASEPLTPGLSPETLASARRERQTVSRDLLRGFIVLSEVLADFLTCAVGVFAAYFLYLSLHIGRQVQYSVRIVGVVGIVTGLFATLLLHRNGAYRHNSSLLQIRETERAIRISTQSLLLLLPFSFLLNLNFSRAAFLIALLLIPLLLTIEKQGFASIIRALHVRGYGIDRVVVYGTGDTARRLVSTLLYSPRLGLYPVAVIDDSPELDRDFMFEMGYRRGRSVPVQRGSITPALLKSYQCHVLIVAIPEPSSEKLIAAADAAKQAGLRVAFLPSPMVHEWQWTESLDLDGVLLTSIIDPVIPWYYTIAKRTTDLAISFFLLLLLAPLLFLIALMIRLDSPGPALFVQKRVGLKGKLFKMYKFRSMHMDTPKYDISPAESGDHRITRLGKFLRRASLDELPQLLNVLLGNMSLVGPRPEMPFIAERYNAQHRQRLQVIPGITGLWQLSADRAFHIHENIQYDFYYIRNRTFFMDIAILIHTLFFAMRGV